MPYICYCEDGPEGTAKRQEHMAAHLAYIESILDKILVAGPMGEINSDSFASSCFVYDTQTPEETMGLLHNDPYYQAGVYKSVDCRRFLAVAGTWVGGKTW
jgi:uncharacterized protein YciI